MATTLKDRLKKEREDLKNRKNSGQIIYLKDGQTKRVRILNMGDEETFCQEVTQFYLGADIKGVISPSTFNEPCGIQESYDELKSSDEDDDKELAAKFPPRQRWLALCAVYKDEAGKELDEQNSPKFVLLTGGMYQEILDLYLDEGEWGDMTDPIKGYDLKLSRSGSGKTDTEYSVKPCKNTKTPKAFAKKVYNLEEEVRKIIPTYEKTKELINQFLGLSPDEDDDKPRNKKSRGGDLENTPPKKKLLKKK